MYSNGSNNASGTTSVVADGRCGLGLTPVCSFYLFFMFLQIAGVIEIYGCRGSADNAEDGASSDIGTSSLSSEMSGESGGGMNVVCPFCMIPKEIVNAWMEDINDIDASTTDQPGISVPPRLICKGHTPVSAQDGIFCDEVF